MDEQEQKILETIKEFSKKLPKFPDGRIDYSNSNIAPVISVFVKHEDRILLLKRSNKVRVYQDIWSAIAGYLDELKPITQKVLEEIQEELGIKTAEDNILSIKIGRPYEFEDNRIQKTWISHPVLIELKHKPQIKLDWEHVDYKWIKPEELKNFDTPPKLGESLKRVMD